MFWMQQHVRPSSGLQGQKASVHGMQGFAEGCSGDEKITEE